MRFVTCLWEFILASLRRLLARKGTALAALLGLTLAITLILSIALYADSVYYQTFLDNVAKTRENPENRLSRENPTFTLLYHYFGGWHGHKSWKELAPLDEFFTRSGVNRLGIPVIDLVRLFGSDVFFLFPEGDAGVANRLSLSRTSFGTMSGLSEHITLVAGHFPNPQPVEDGNPIEVLVSQNLATTTGLAIGQRLNAHVSIQGESGQKESTRIPVIIAGIWQANDRGDDYWIFPASTYESILFVPPETFFQRLTAQLPGLVYNAYWYLILAADYVHADEIDSLLDRFARLERDANQLQENLWVSISPKEALEQYATEARLLRVLLYAFSIPVVGLIVAFVGLVTRLSTDQRRNEIAILRSRGGSVAQLLSLTALEGIVIAAIALAASLPLASLVTQSISQTRAFLDFDASAPLRVGLSTGAWQIGLFCALAFLGILLLPAARAAQDTVLAYKRQAGRPEKPPAWQRAWLDLLLFIPAVYGAVLLRQQGGLSALGNGIDQADPFKNPLLFLVPSLCLLALSLFSLRLIGPIMTLIDRLASLSRRAGLTMAARHISRMAGHYHTPLLILTLTMSLFAYTASLSATFDQALSDQAYYQVGADIRFFDPGDSTTTEAVTWWDFLPVSEYARAEGVAGAARLGRYAMHITIGRIDADGLFFGVDRLDFPQVAYWRNDFAAESLGALMNALAADPGGVLVDAAFLQQSGLRIGDSVFLAVKTQNRISELTATIVGAFDLFPGWYPEQGPLFVGNLDYLFEASDLDTAAGPVPYYVLLKSDAGVDPAQLEADLLRGLDARVRPVDWQTPITMIRASQNQPERQGFLGFLFLGFATAILLTVLAFLLHLVFTFQQRAVEFGVLRAAGLSIPQMIANLVWEFAFLIVLGGGIGTGLGVLASKFFIPTMQIGSESSALIPPFQVLIPWQTILQIYWLFGALFGLSLLVSVAALRQMKIFEAIKLGETV